MLAAHLVQRVCRKMSRKVLPLAAETLALLRRHDWPGNGRELLNALERAVVFCKTPELEPSDFPHYVTDEAGLPGAHSRALSSVERLHIVRVLDETDWNVSRAANDLQIDRGTLYAKIRKYGLERPAGHGS